MRIAINGMGRIGRLLFRRLINHEQIDIIAINDIMPVDNLAYLLKYDSIYGTFEKDVIIKGDTIVVENKAITVLRQEDASNLPWKELNIDMVLECTGNYTTQANAEKHLTAGAKKVLLSTTGADDIPLLIYGFNQTRVNSNANIISPGGCMTNCCIHILYILNAISIRSAQINILHSYTSRQELVDAPNKNFRRGRAAAESIIPVDIDLHKSLERLMPGIRDKVSTTSIRVPVANGAMALFSVQLNAEVGREQINSMFKKAAADSYKGIMAYTEEPLVSLDIKGNTHSCIVDGTQTSVIGNHVNLVAWFDNEYGFTSRMIDWLDLLNKTIDRF